MLKTTAYTYAQCYFHEKYLEMAEKNNVEFNRE
jgi:hypothetical protein